MAESWNSSTVSLLLVSITMAVLLSTDAAIPAIYIFGDSMVDVGTNNHLNQTFAKGNHAPNGIDFPGGVATGRFSNGLNSADFISKLMGFEMSPRPYLDLLDDKTHRPTKDIIKGANFASAAGGIFDDSHNLLGKVFDLGAQIQQFATAREELEKLLGTEPTNTVLSKSVFVLSIGNNDLFKTLLNRTQDQEEFISRIVSTYETRLRALYSLGARKLGIVSVSALGCCPSERLRNVTGGCMDDLNGYAQSFYRNVGTMLQKLTSEFKDMKYSLGNLMEIVYEMINDPKPFNFREVQSPCCGSGRANAQVPCFPASKVCANRGEYMFWDRHHPTEAAAKFGAEMLYYGSSRFVAPINFKQLEDDN